jgi:hypothetical protein
MSTGVLYDIREERFCHFVATGIPPRVARTQAGYPKGTRWSLKRLLSEPRIKKRLDELMEGVAKRAQLSRAKILDDIAEEWRLARANKQHSAALKAAEMLGSELHGMFRKQVDLTTRDEFSGMSSEELRGFIFKQLKQMGLSLEDIPKFIDAKVIDSKIEDMKQLATKQEIEPDEILSDDPEQSPDPLAPEPSGS